MSGLADGPSGRGWAEVEGDSALRHARDGDPLQVKFVVGPLARWLGLPNTVAVLWEELPQLGLAAALLYHVCLGTLLAQRGSALYSLDGLIKEIGWSPRTIAERQQKRRIVWRWLTAFDGWTVIGRRKGHYRDPVTRTVPDLWIDSALFRIVERSYIEPSQLALDGSCPPFEVTLAAGPWLNEFRDNGRVLTYFGDIRRIAAIPAGKPSGAWAQAIGLSLQQRWRERATYARVNRVGDDKHLTIDAGSFTRRDLLTLFPPFPTIERVLSGDHPGRAKVYWRDAIAALKAKGIIAHYREMSPLRSGRQGWEQAWLDQPLDVRPDDLGKANLKMLADKARSARSGKRTRQADVS